MFRTYITPLLSASASAPITLTVVYGPARPPKPAESFTYTVTGKDLDTWKNYGVTPNQTLEVPNTLLCTSLGEEYHVDSGPNRRSVMDGTTIWDFVVFGLSIIKGDDADGHTVPRQVYVNRYRISNPLGRNSTLLDDNPVDVEQTIIRPEYIDYELSHI